MNVLGTDLCETCTLNLLAEREAACDGSGVIAISDYPLSRVIVCPEWEEADEPPAYYEAIEGLHYDDIPPTMQQRIRDNVMREINGTPQDGGYEESTGVARAFLVALVLGLPVLIGLIAFASWVLA